MKGWPIRLLLLLLCITGGFVLAYKASSNVIHGFIGLGVGLCLAFAAFALETALEKRENQEFFGGALGLVAGLLAAELLNRSFAGLAGGTAGLYGSFFLTLILGYVGLVIGSRKFGGFPAIGTAAAESAAHAGGKPADQKILDTSVIIDGRIADLCETGFLEGTFVIPQFVLRELQHIADSSDTLKRNRGRRGLDILHKLQKNVDLQVVIVETDFPRIREVDSKLIALAKSEGGRIITNDFNLNKIAELQGVTVLNINQLANSLKPVVLPGELMKVYVLKEGKESNQGVAYLDDGTMVVIDNGRRQIGKTVDVLVTSVLQTTAGRMIFTQLKEDARNGQYTAEKSAS